MSENNNFESNIERTEVIRHKKVQAKRKAAQIKKSCRHRKIFIAVGVIALIAVLFGMIMLFHFNTADSTLTGKWAIDDTTIYLFNKDGTGTMILPSSQYEFTYTVNDDILSIDFESSNAKDKDYKYSIKGKTLTITDTSKYGDTYTLKPAK